MEVIRRKGCNKNILTNINISKYLSVWDIAKNQTSNVSVKGIRKSINKKINERKFLTAAMRKIKVKDQDRQE